MSHWKLSFIIARPKMGQGQWETGRLQSWVSGVQGEEPVVYAGIKSPHPMPAQFHDSVQRMCWVVAVAQDISTPPVSVSVMIGPGPLSPLRLHVSCQIWSRCPSRVKGSQATLSVHCLTCPWPPCLSLYKVCVLSLRSPEPSSTRAPCPLSPLEWKCHLNA